MDWKFSTIILLGLGLSACSLIQRNHDSGYYSEDDADPQWRRSPASSEEVSFGRGSPAERDADLYERRARKNRDQLGLMISKHREFASVVEQRDIALGMGKDSVRESWGDPRTIDVAGNPSNQNERWHYIEYVSSQEGYMEQHRIVYFEHGEVVGWQTE